MIQVVTDSTAYVPARLVSTYNILVVPLKVQFGQESFAETGAFNHQQLFERLAIDSDWPTSSQPAVGEFKQTYRHILDETPDAEILVITVSSKLSGTYNAALNAARQMSQANITVFDSLSAAMGSGLLVITAAEMAGQHRSLTDILYRLAQMRREIRIVLMVDNLTYLKQGGRIGTASAFIGTLLDTKPILTIVAGQIKIIDRVRTKKKALNRLWQLLGQELGHPRQPVQAGVMHAAAPMEMNTLTRMLQDHFNITRLFTAEFGPVISIHLGPGALGVGICPDPR